MRGTDGRKRRRSRRRVWKTASVLLLGLMSSSAGCQWMGERAAVDPGAKTIAQEGPSSRVLVTPTGPEPSAPALIQTGASEPASSPSGLIQTAYQGDPDSPVAEDKNVAGQEAAVSSVLPTNEAGRDDGKRDRSKEEDKGYQVDLSLPSPTQGIATPTIPAPQKVYPITMGQSFALAGVANPVIALAEQAIRVSRAEQLQARVLLMPNVNVGANYGFHNGTYISSFGAVRKVDRQDVLYGFGAQTVATETVHIPGLFINTPLTEVIFNPPIARNVVNNRRFAWRATSNRVLLEVSTAYLALLGAEGRLAIVRQSEEDFKEVARLTADYAKTGLGREGDANRARADLLKLQYTEQQAQEEVVVAAAELSRLLNLDPSVRLQTGDVPIKVVTFIDPKVPFPKLLEIASRNRPELIAAAAKIRASQIRVRKEKWRAAIPILIAGFSADMFGGGAVSGQLGNVPNPHLPNPAGTPTELTAGQTVPKFGRITGRTDVDVMAIWQLQNFGMGNIAHIKQRRAELNQAEAARVHVLNQVGLEVSESYNTAAQQYLSISIERRRVQEASEGFQKDLNLIRAGGALPIEVLNQALRLFTARQDLLAAVIGFDRAQFQLFVALGQPPTLAVNGGAPPPAMPEKKP